MNVHLSQLLSINEQPAARSPGSEPRPPASPAVWYPPHGADDATLARIGVALPLVLHVRVVRGTGGGPDKTILHSPKFLDSDRYRMAAAYIHPRGDEAIQVIRRQAAELGCPIHTISEAGPLDPRTVREMIHLCQRLNVAVWHGHDYKSNLLGLIVAKSHPMRLVTTVHGWTRETWRTKLYTHVDRWCLKHYDQVVAVCPNLYDECLRLGVHKRRLWLIPNAIDPDEYQRQHHRSEVRYQLGVRRDAIVIGMVGRLSPEKGFDRAIRTFAFLRAHYPKLELHMIGDGPLFETLREQARRLRVSDSMRFWGWQSPAHRFYEMMDILLVPSHTEGLPNVALEAMAMGVPVAATGVGGVRALLKNGRRGVVLDRDEGTWPMALAPLIVSRDRRDELARKARRRVEKYYSFEHRMQSVMKVYDRVLRVRRSRSAAKRAA
jgi:glycosyltransferase involved in cell wall biosynthesis